MKDKFGSADAYMTRIARGILESSESELGTLVSELATSSECRLTDLRFGSSLGVILTSVDYAREFAEERLKKLLQDFSWGRMDDVFINNKDIPVHRLS